MKLPFEDPEYSRGRYDIWLMPWIRNRIARNMDVLGLFVGPRGSGKSYSALELAYTCDATFNQGKVMFDVTDFVDYVIDGNLRKGNSVILDDAGVFMNARDWQTVQNKAISVVAQSFRYRNLITFITVPKWNYIDSQTRGLINIFFEATKEQGVFKIKLPEPNPFKAGDDFMVYPRVQTPNKGMRTRTVTVKTVQFSLPGCLPSSAGASGLPSASSLSLCPSLPHTDQLTTLVEGRTGQSSLLRSLSSSPC